MNINFEDLAKSIYNETKHKDVISGFLNELEERLEKMNEKEYTIDRFEGEFAVCEDRDTKEMIDINTNDLPANAKEGSVLMYKDGKYVMSTKEKEISERIKKKMDNLWNN